MESSEAFPEVLRVKDVAKLIGMSPTFVYKEVQLGNITHIRRGGKIAFRPEWVDSYLNAATRLAPFDRPKGLNTAAVAETKPRKR